MLNYFSSTTYHSQLPGFEGVSFELRMFSERRRMELQLELSCALNRLRELSAEDRGGAADECNPLSVVEAARRQDEMDRIIACDVEPAYVRTVLKRVHGMKIDGREPDADLLFAEGPSELWLELTGIVREMTGLSEADSKN